MSILNQHSSQEAERIFSPQRLRKIEEIYNVSGNDTILLHEQLNEISSTVFQSISLFEVHFRNIIICCLKETFGDSWWNSSLFANDPQLKNLIQQAIKRAKRNNYAKLAYAARKRLKADVLSSPIGNKSLSQHQKDEAKKNVSYTEGDLVSQLYVSFWKSLFSKSYETKLWRRCLRRLFPDKNITRGQVIDALETIHKTRNRVAHNEFIHPILCENYLNAVKFLTKNLRYKGHIRKSRIYRFHLPSINKIQLELLNFRHFLEIYYAR